MTDNRYMDDWAEIKLAWELAECAGLNIPEATRISVYATIGSGEGYAAISTLLEAIADAHLVVPPDTVRKIVDWFNAYAHHRDAARLNELLNAIRLG